MAEKKLHLIVFGAHVGDAEVTAGAVVCKYTRAGHRATIVHLTAGEKGHPTMPPEEYRAQRLEEAAAAAKTMGADVRVLDYRDGELPSTEEVKLHVCDLIRELKPDIVITHWRGSFHRDHRRCYENVMEGAFLAALPGIDRPYPRHLVRGLYYAENWEDMEEYVPSLWIDVTDVYNQWVEVMKCLALCRGELGGFDYLGYYQGLAAMRGAEVGVRYAKTFALPPISRKRRLQFFPEDEPALIY